MTVDSTANRTSSSIDGAEKASLTIYMEHVIPLLEATRKHELFYPAPYPVSQLEFLSYS